MGTLRKLATYRNVRHVLMRTNNNRDKALQKAARLLIGRGVLKPGAPDGTNMIKVRQEG